MTRDQRLLGAAIAAAFACGPARAADAPVVLSEGRGFSQQDGEALYRAVCQSCHMADGQGARGAGAYPALAANPRLAAAAYPVVNILHGRKGMPAFGGALSDEQVAQVTNYVRTHLGNSYTDAVTPADVTSLRRKTP
ncbi:MAG TPA: cytochrome c [Burkholderiaceae bacterium]|nr:cytochrome c [Burkholderiaceae bacterium]